MKAREVYKNVIMSGMHNALDIIWNRFVENELIEQELLVPALGAKIFEVGSGRGYVCKSLKERDTTCYVVGTDVSDNISEVEQHADEAIILDIVEDEAEFEDEYFDVVMAYEVLEHVSSPYHAIMQMKRLCKIDGKIHITIPDYETQVGYKSHKHAFVYPGLFLNEYFKIFLTQLYLDIELHTIFENPTVHSNPKHHYYLCRNLENKSDILQVVAGDYDHHVLYPFAVERGIIS